MFRRHERIWVSASDAGSAVFCPHSVQLKYAGAKVNRSARQARKAGIRSHEELNAAVDSRCFVATCVYGANDRRTWNLRTYRDEILGRSAPGRALIKVYYRLSPHLVRLAYRRAAVRSCLRFCLNICIGETVRDSDK